MKFSEEHFQIKDLVRKRMADLDQAGKPIQDEARKIAVMIKKHERHGASFPWVFVREMAELGLTGINISQEYGGAGMDNLSGVIAMIEMSKVWPGGALILGVGNSLVGDLISRLGNDAQKKEWLSNLASGKILGSFCLTEPNHGSDAAHIETHAEPVSGGFIISGEKCFSTNAPVAKFLIVFARTDRAIKDHRGVSAFLIPVRREDKKSKALEIRKPDQKLGLHAAHMGGVRFNGLFVPESCLLGDLMSGFGKGAMTTLNHGRNWIAAQGVGILNATLALALSHAQNRVAFGAPIITRSGVGDPIVRMALAADISRILLFYSAWLEDRGAEFAHYASLAKLFSSESARVLTQEAQRIYGGSGYLLEIEIARFVLDSLPLDIYEGASNVQRSNIARAWVDGKISFYVPPLYRQELESRKAVVAKRLEDKSALLLTDQRLPFETADILPLWIARELILREFNEEWPKAFMLFRNPLLLLSLIQEQIKKDLDGGIERNGNLWDEAKEHILKNAALQ